MISNLGHFDPALLPLPPVPERILTVVANCSGVSISRLLAHRNFERDSFARFVAMYLMREMTDLNFRQIGELLGGRDHSTIFHGCQVIRQRIAASPQFAAVIGALKVEVGG